MHQRRTVLRVIVAGGLIAVILSILVLSSRPVPLGGAALIVIAVGGLCALALTRRSAE